MVAHGRKFNSWAMFADKYAQRRSMRWTLIPHSQQWVRRDIPNWKQWNGERLVYIDGFGVFEMLAL